MVERTNLNIARNSNTSTDSGNRTHLASRQTFKDNSINDDVIAYLANSHENRRARQVTQWDRIGKISLWRAVG